MRRGVVPAKSVVPGPTRELHCRMWADSPLGLESTAVRYALLVVTFLTASPTSRASLWDDETLAAEANGLPDLVRIITGRFERNPPLYYEMRLSRAAGRIKAEPNDLVAYDVAGVACDRLGRGDEAIAWMEQKNLQMAAMVVSGARKSEDLRDHYYRCLANIGTFWVHRWARGGRLVAAGRSQDGARLYREGDQTLSPHAIRARSLSIDDARADHCTAGVHDGKAPVSSRLQ